LQEIVFLDWKTHPAKSQQQLDVASERQIAANRRNAGKSTGPRYRGGKKRACQNAYCHGLSLNIGASAAEAKQIETLARKIARDADRDPEDAAALQNSTSHACDGQSSS
jgi:hypothetical protein